MSDRQPADVWSNGWADVRRIQTSVLALNSLRGPRKPQVC